MKIKFSERDFCRKSLPELSGKDLEEYAEFVAARLGEMGYDDRQKSNKTLITYAAKYLAGQYRSGGESPTYGKPRRGLILSGPRGTGKTEFLRRFAAMADICLVDARDLAWAFQVGGAAAVDELLRQCQYQDMIIDDIANEDEARSWGNAFSLGTIIDKRYRLWSLPCGVLTFFATNATPDELGKRYGATIYSRISGMCNEVKFSGNDRRLER